MVFLAWLGLPLRGIIAGVDALWLGLCWRGAVLLCSEEKEDGEERGSWAFVAACAGGLTWWSADHLGFDLATAAVVLQTVGWLKASEGLEKRKESVFFGLWLGAAFLTKYSAPLILFLPVAWECGRGARKNPKNLGFAVVAWALVAALWLGMNGQAVLEYVGSALNPGVGPGNLPEQRQLWERFAGQGQAMFLAVLKDALGLPLLFLLIISAFWNRSGISLFGFFSGILFLGAMNSREGRYALPMLFLLTTAGAPRKAGGWQQVVMLLALVLPAIRGNFVAFQQDTLENTPSRRPLDHPLSTFRTIGSWPALQFSPLSEHPDSWKIHEALTAASEHLDANRVLGILLSTLPDAPTSSSVYQLVAEMDGIRVDLLTVHALSTNQGLTTNSYRGPLSTQDDAPPPLPGELRREPSLTKLFYVVTHPTQPAGLRWLSETPHQVLASWQLPNGHTGQLIVKQ